MTPLATLGHINDPVSVTHFTKLAVDSHGHLFAAPTAGGQIAMYDSRGGFLRSYGRAGEGPGEFRGSIRHILVGRGDTIHVIESIRHTVFAPDLSSFLYLRNLPQSPNDVVFHPDGPLVLQFTRADGDRPAHALHLMGADGVIVQSFGGKQPLRRDQLYETLRVLANAGNGEIWSARVNEYRIERWRPNDVETLVVIRDAAWFEPWTRYDPREPLRAKPRPRITSVYEDKEQRLWVGISVADDEWQPVEGSGEIPLKEIIPSELFDTMLEVLDLRRERVLARTRLDGVVLSVANWPIVYSTRIGGVGEVVIDVWRVEISDQQVKEGTMP